MLNEVPMKILIFGIDGLGEESLKVLGLKKLAARMKNGKLDNPKIQNVISRGWPELYTGKDAFETGGFYQVPEYRNGKILATQNTGLTTIKKIINNDDLLWKALNNLDYKVGLFTVPTISVPEEINGFCVAGTGGGKFGNTVSTDDLYPKNLFDGLHIKDIDLGFRMGSGAYIPEDILDLEQNGNKHIADYFFTLERLLNKNDVDACFCASRFIAEMAFKFIGLSSTKNEYEKKLKKTVLSLCENFDSVLDDFLEKINPEHLFIVSDHGIGKYKYDLNLNQILCENKLIKRITTIKDRLRPFVNKTRYILYNRRYLPAPPHYFLEGAEFFSIGYINALYLNDDRFSGSPIEPELAYEKSINMTNILNNWLSENNLSDKLHFRAIKYPANIGQGETKVAIPNIICDMESGFNNSERALLALSEKDYYFEEMFDKGFHGEHSGCKTNDTIAYYSGSYSEHVDLSNLKNIYHSIINVAKEGDKKQ